MPKVPRYANFKPASASASRIKKKNRSRNTKAELLLRKKLWALGLRYRLCVPSLPGKPDIVFRAARVAVFCDGDFWHGREWRTRRKKLALGANAAYWTAKIASNIRRDLERTRELQRLGWKVVRLWETDILSDVRTAAETVQTAVTGRASKVAARHARNFHGA
jgi:DNA mismatch endonuclease (patch repair protein)